MSKHPLITNLESLTDEEMESVARLINKFNQRKVNTGEPKVRDHVDKKPKRRDHSNDELELEVKRQKGRKNPRKRIVTDETEPREFSSRGVGRTQPRRNPRVDIDSPSPRRRKGVACRTESVQIDNRRNKFLEMKSRNGKLCNAEKQDVEIDRKLWKNRTPADRPETFEPVEVQCKVCNRYFDINPALVLTDDDTGEVNFTCDNCVPRG